MRPELLLHPNVPKPLHGMSPRELLGDVWWNETRKTVYKNAKDECQCCGVHKQDAKYHKWLEAHETYSYDYKNGVATVTEIVALCHSCHAYIHSGLLQVLWTTGKISNEKYQDILSHGDKIIKESGLKRPERPTQIAEWSKWCIVIEGKKYKTKWKSFEHWAKHYNR